MESQFVQSSPGRNHLPAWNRTGLCRKPQKEVRKLSRDRLPPIVDLEERSEEVSSALVTMLRNKVMQLEKSVGFLKKQHQDTLGMLHKEVEQLKLLNRGEQICLVLTFSVWLLKNQFCEC